jgi:hypothetical protein
MLDKWDYLRPWHRVWWIEMANVAKAFLEESGIALRDVIFTPKPVPWTQRAGKGIELHRRLDHGFRIRDRVRAPAARAPLAALPLAQPDGILRSCGEQLWQFLLRSRGRRTFDPSSYFTP